MWSSFVLGILLVLKIFPLLSKGLSLSNLGDVSLYGTALGLMETAYFIISDNEYTIYFPTRLLLPGLQQVCLLLLQNQDVVCTFSPPTKPFILVGNFKNTIAINWQTMYSNESSSPESTDVYMTTENVYYNIIGVKNRPKFPLRADLVSPAFGTIMSKDLKIVYNVNGNYLPEQIVVMDSSHVDFQVQGILTGHSAPMNSKEIIGQSDVEPGSWFLSLTPIIDSIDDDQGGIIRSEGYPNPGYVEFVLPPEEIEKNRRYSTAWKNDLININNAAPFAEESQKITEDKNTCRTNATLTRVCVWGTFKMDGQKNIFLKQMQYMNKQRFAFTWVVAQWPAEASGIIDIEEDKQHAEVRNRLKQMPHVNVVLSPYASLAIDLKVVDSESEKGDVPLSALFQRNESAMYEYVTSRFKQAGGEIDRMGPPWVKKLYTDMRTHMRGEQCEIVVYGNNRGLSSNMLITDTARALDIPTVSELLNLFINPDTVPTAVVGPSTYSIEHERDVLMSEMNRGGVSTVSVVIPPSVDLDRFDPDKILEENVIYHPYCARIRLENPSVKCYTIGFVARLSAEKNPGLFLLAAERILMQNPFIRFTMVGDGDLRPYLENLAHRLGISWAVHFAGWISEDELPRILKGFDVLINPSLRAWSETFCISNIEAMSMRIPLVTFAVGGIGEYIEDPRSHPEYKSDTGSSEFPSFSMSNNAVVLNIATPQAVAEAVLFLINNRTVRLAVGESGRKMVTSYFTVERQMRQYALLYDQLVGVKACY